MSDRMRDFSAASRRIEAATVVAALERALPAAPVGAEGVRVAIARRLASQLDEPMPGYALARVASELRAMLDELEPGERSEGGSEQARRILGELRAL
jgi:hypothetical protein